MRCVEGVGGVESVPRRYILEDSSVSVPFNMSSAEAEAGFYTGVWVWEVWKVRECGEGTH